MRERGIFDKLVLFLKETDKISLASYMWELKKRTGCEVRLEGSALIFHIAQGHNPESIVKELRRIVSF